MRLYFCTPAPVRQGSKTLSPKTRGRELEKEPGINLWSLHTHAHLHTSKPHMHEHAHTEKKKEKRETSLFFYVNQVSGNEILIPRYLFYLDQ